MISKNIELTLNNRQARRFLLAYQYLWPPGTLKGKAGILEFIRHVACVQYDPLNIVGRNPELVLQSRISDFKPQYLHDLLYTDRKLIDGLDKMMAIYAVEDRPYFSRHREGAKQRFDNASRPAARILPEVRKAIEQRGPLSSIDLKYDRVVDWSWGPTRIARAALESMYLSGELIVHHKIGTRKVYDFAKHHIPDNILSTPDPNSSEEQYHDWHVKRRLGGVGMLWNQSSEAWLGIPGVKSKQRTSALSRLLEKRQILPVRVEGTKGQFFILAEDEKLLHRVSDMRMPSPQASILAPLDNLLWDRKLVREIFNFDYVWEVYKPVPERKYGYYVLPIIYGDTFVARFEPGRDKASNALTVKNWWWEPGISIPGRMEKALKRCFKRFLRNLGADRIQTDDRVTLIPHMSWLQELTV